MQPKLQGERERKIKQAPLALGTPPPPPYTGLYSWGEIKSASTEGLAGLPSCSTDGHYSGVTLSVARPDMNNYATLGVMLYKGIGGSKNFALWDLARRATSGFVPH